MEIEIARVYKRELQKKLAEMLKDFENTTGVEACSIEFVRQSQSDALGNEVRFDYAVEVKVML